MSEGKKRSVVGTLFKIALGFLVPAGFVVGYVIATMPHLRAFPWLPSSYDAKEACSCAFVVGRSDAACGAYVDQDVVPIQSRIIDREQKTVTTTALFLSSTARWEGPTLGCRLD